MKRKLKWIIPFIILVCLAVMIVLYAEDYYHASEDAEKALISDSLVQVEKTDYGWFFDGPSKKDALIFYPGGKVEETAYAPLLHLLAENGIDVFLAKMPMRLAILDTNRAESIIKRYDYQHWYIGGHSLGGACSTAYAAKHADSLDGVILLAAYPMKQLDDSLNVLFIYGSEDGVLNRQKYADSKKYAPSDAMEYILEGGNHAQFGSYGIQNGDGIALISPVEQWNLTLELILDNISLPDATPAY